MFFSPQIQQSLDFSSSNSSISIHVAFSSGNAFFSKNSSKNSSCIYFYFISLYIFISKINASIHNIFGCIACKRDKCCYFNILAPLHLSESKKTKCAQLHVSDKWRLGRAEFILTYFIHPHTWPNIKKVQNMKINIYNP